jgi:uracil-DNA glycosylase family 4
MAIDNCDACGLHRLCKKPRMRGAGNSVNPTLLIISESSEKSEDFDNTIGRTGRLLAEVLGDEEKDVFITRAVKCCPYKDHFNEQRGTVTPTSEQINYCKIFLLRELKLFKPEETAIMTLGISALSALVDKHKEIENEVGEVRFEYINGTRWKIIPNYHPYYALRDSSIEREFRTITRQALYHNKVESEEEKKYLIVDPARAIKETKLIIEAYDEGKGKIDHVVYDCETTGFSPWKDRIIMYSFYNSKVNDKAIAVPIHISNINHHEDYPYKDKIVPIKWDLSAKDIAKINKAIGEMIEAVPIIAQQAKFDISFAIAHNIAKLENIKVFYDTLLLAHILVGRQTFGALDLKTLCIKLFGAANWEAPVDSYMRLFHKLSDRTYDKIPTSILGEYAAKDVYYTEMLFTLLEKDINETTKVSIDLLHNILPVFTEAESKGIFFDNSNFDYIKEAYEKMIKKERKTMAELIPDWIYPREKAFLAENAKKKKPMSEEELEKKIFNPGSTQQRSSILFGYFKMKSVKEGKSGDHSSDKEVIDSLLKNKDIKEEGKKFLTSLSEYTVLKKLTTSYLENTNEMLDGDIYHPSYQINGTITGRHSSGYHTLPRKCLTGDTKISLLNGTEVEIKDLVNKDNFWVFSRDPQGAIVPGLGHSAKITKYITEMCEVILDNNEVIKCTPDHLFMLRDGSYKEAQNLTIKDNLMPLYRILTNGTGAIDRQHPEKNKYYSVQPLRGKLKPLHRLIYNILFGDSEIVHHDDGNTINNDPDNLIGTTKSWHSSHHLKEKWDDLENNKYLLNVRIWNEYRRANHSIRTSKMWKEADAEKIKRMAWSGFSREKALTRRRELLKDEDHKKEIYKKVVNNRDPEKWDKNVNERLRNNWKDPEYATKMKKAQSLSPIVSIIKEYLTKYPTLIEEQYNIYRKTRKNKNTPKWNNLFKKTNSSSIEELLNFCDTYNHKIKEVKIITVDPTPMYDITVEKYGNFALSAGVFVHNSDIKRLFTSRWSSEGGLFGCFDFSQLELRVAASLADEQTWLKAFDDGLDIHTQTASIIYNKAISKVTKDQRKAAKTCVFGLTYGLSDKSLGEQLGITTRAASKIKESLFAGCTSLSEWFQKCYDEVNAKHEIVTVFGRTIPINMKNKFDEEDKEANQRRSVNYKVQCILGSTKIPLLSGKEVKIEELEGKGNIWVYSVDPDKNEVVPALASRFFKSGETNKLIKITLDNGKDITCTSKHMFMLKDGSYMPADYLSVDDSLKPVVGSVRIKSIEDIILDNPVSVYDVEVPDYHNFAVSAGVFIHNSPASDLVTDSIGRIYKVMKNRDVNLLNIESQSILATHFNNSIEELIKRASDANLKSIIVGSVHDSILFDIYPGELTTIIKLVKYVCEVENREKYPWIKCPIIVDTSIGTSWGSCLDFNVEYTDKGIKLLCKEGLRKDFRLLFNIAENFYKWEYNIISETEIKEEDQPKDKVIKDRFNWAVEILIGRG